jgi:translation initiation factor 1
MKELDSFLPTNLNDVLETLDKERTPLKMTTEKRAYGKKVTLISGFDKTTNVKKIAKLLKSQCATGGTIKNNVIELQGDQVRRATTLLEKENYQVDYIR